jgi:hypothetical protein
MTNDWFYNNRKKKDESQGNSVTLELWCTTQVSQQPPKTSPWTQTKSCWQIESVDVEHEPRNVKIPDRVFSVWVSGGKCSRPWDTGWGRKGWMWRVMSNLKTETRLRASLSRIIFWWKLKSERRLCTRIVCHNRREKLIWNDLNLFDYYESMKWKLI